MRICEKFQITNNLLFLLLISSIAIGFTDRALAQAVPLNTSSTPTVSVAIEEPDSKEAVRALVSTLSDDAVRALLIERLDAVAEARQNASSNSVGLVQISRDRFAEYFSYARDTLSMSGQIPEIMGKIVASIQSSSEIGIAKFLVTVLAALALGGLAERAVARFFKTRKQKLIATFSNSLWGILEILYTRLGYDVLGVLAFGFGSYLLINNFFSSSSLNYAIASTIVDTILSGWLAYIMCRFFFAPRNPKIRICQTSDRRAMQITVSFSLLAAFIVGMHNAYYLFNQIDREFFGETNFFRPLGYMINLSLYVAAIGVIVYNRIGLTEVLTENKKRVSLAIGGDSNVNLSWFAVNWPFIASALILSKYFLVEIIISTGHAGIYSSSAVYITFIVIFLWPGIDANISLFVAKGINVAENESEAASIARRNMQQGLLRVGRVLVVGTVSYALASLWGLNLMDIANSGLGAQAAGSLVEFLFIVLVAYICWELVSALIGYWIAVESGNSEGAGEDSGDEIGGVGYSRIATLLPIIRKTAQFIIIVISIIMMLDNWGVNIGPILAGAGVVGLAIGFGAQTLVKDIVSGLFFLADDAFRVGEYIDVGGTMGSVEKISLRSLRLRHHKGLVHTIPYGEIPKLTNFSRDWVIVKLRFRVPFDTDISKVKKIFKIIGAELLADPILGEDFLQPFKSQGVAEVDDNGIVVRGKFMAKPGKQFMIRKEVYVRVQKAFDEAGIPFARKQVMVHIPGLEKEHKLSESDVKSIGAAATEAADEQPQPVKGD